MDPLKMYFLLKMEISIAILAYQRVVGKLGDSPLPFRAI